MTSLVGYTGFVGSNIFASAQNQIDKVYNTKNIESAYETNPELLIYSGVRAEKFLANKNPQEDFKQINVAIENIKKINPKRLVLISTVDVLDDPINKDENSYILSENLQPYGQNRYFLEQWVKKTFDNSLIVRLPALYGINLKKNFIYDFINLIPSMLNENKYFELSDKNPIIRESYFLQQNGFYKCKDLKDDEKKYLKNFFESINFTALNFTDSRNVYQFYPLNRLWDDIQVLLQTNIRLVHLATQGIMARELYNYLTDKSFENEILEKPLVYDFKTKYANLFGGKDGYILSKAEILKDIKQFVENQKQL